MGAECFLRPLHTLGHTISSHLSLQWVHNPPQLLLSVAWCWVFPVEAYPRHDIVVSETFTVLLSFLNGHPSGMGMHYGDLLLLTFSSNTHLSGTALCLQFQ